MKQRLVSFNNPLFICRRKRNSAHDHTFPFIPGDSAFVPHEMSREASLRAIHLILMASSTHQTRESGGHTTPESVLVRFNDQMQNLERQRVFSGLVSASATVLGRDSSGSVQVHPNNLTFQSPHLTQVRAAGNQFEHHPLSSVSLSSGYQQAMQINDRDAYFRRCLSEQVRRQNYDNGGALQRNYSNPLMPSSMGNVTWPTSACLLPTSNRHNAPFIGSSSKQVAKQVKMPQCLPFVLAMPLDVLKVSSHQVLLRYQVEAFQATEEDISTHTRGRNKPIMLGQVGIRCRHCAHLPVLQRQKGSTYFPSTTWGLYQAAQNMSTTHMQFGLCTEMPEDIKFTFAQLMATKSSSSGAGRPYWAESAKSVGLVDTEDGIWFMRDLSANARILHIGNKTQLKKETSKEKKGA